MKILPQKEFIADLSHESSNEPLIIHQLSKGGAAGLVLFVHGLGGTRYQYWGQLPHFLSRGVSNIDLGFYFYRSGLRRIGFLKSLELKDEAELLADVIRDLPRYRSIVVIGHSLGGILARGAVARLLEIRARSVLKRVHGVILIASPGSGSSRVPSFLRWMSKDAQVLFPHNRYLRRVATQWEHVEIDEDANPATARNIPTWAVFSPGDFWVAPLSAGLGIPLEQTRAVREDHGSIIRPTHEEQDAYAFVRARVEQCVRQPMVRSFDRELSCRPVSAEDLGGIKKLGEELLGLQGTSEMDNLVLECTDRFPGSAIVVGKRWSSEVERHEKLVGYAVTLLMSPAAAMEIKANRLRASDFRAEHLADANGPIGAVYIGAIAAAGTAARGVALECVRGIIREYVRKGASEILTRPLTEDGFRLVKRNKFRPATKEVEGLRALYIMQGNQKP